MSSSSLTSSPVRASSMPPMCRSFALEDDGALQVAKHAFAQFKSSRNIIFITGAGISVSSGIPVGLFQFVVLIVFVEW